MKKFLNLCLRKIAMVIGLVVLLVIWYGLWLVGHTVCFQSVVGGNNPYLVEWIVSGAVIVGCAWYIYWQFICWYRKSLLPLIMLITFVGLYLSSIWVTDWLMIGAFTLILAVCLWMIEYRYPDLYDSDNVWLAVHLFAMSVSGTWNALFWAKSDLAKENYQIGIFLLVLTLLTGSKILFGEKKKNKT